MGFAGISWQDNPVEASEPRSNTLIVDQHGRGDYTAIQQAIDVASVGDTILVWAGIYYERLTIKKSLNLIGNHSTSTFIDARGSCDVINILADNVKISGFMLMNSGHYYDPGSEPWEWNENAGIALFGDNIHIFENIVAYNYYGIKVNLSGSNNTIENNLCYSNVHDILCFGNDNKIMNNTCPVGGLISCIGDRNLVADNTCLDGSGIYTRGRWNKIIRNNCSNSQAFSCLGNLNLIINNSCYNNKYGLILYSNSYPYFMSENSTIMNNYFVSNKYGIMSGGKSNIIKNNIFAKNTVGICAGSNIIFNNRFIDNDVGIDLSKGTSAEIKNNKFLSCGFEFRYDDYPFNYNYSISSTNTVNGKPVYYWRNITNQVVPTGAGQIILLNCSRIRIENQNCSDSTSGIITVFSNNITLKNNTCNSNTHFGIRLWYSNFCTITDNICSGNSIGIGIDNDDFWFYQSHSNYITRNSCLNNIIGVYLYGTYNCVLNKNNCSDNLYYGIESYYSDNITLSDNICNNNKYGIWLYYSTNFKLYKNKMTRCGVGIRTYNDYYGMSQRSISSGYIIGKDNTVNNKPIYFWVDEHDKTVPSGAGQVILVSCYNITIKNQNLCYGSIGILVEYSYFITIINNNCSSNNDYGIRVIDSWSNSIENNICNFNGGDGLRCDWNCDYSIIRNNTCNSNGNDGIFLDNCKYNLISENICNLNGHSGYGQTGCSWSNVLRNNYLSSNKRYGIYLGGPSNTTLFNNKMVSCGLFFHQYYYYEDYWNYITIGTNNTVNGKPLIFLKDKNQYIVPPGAGQIILVNCSNITIKNQNVSQSTHGILLIYSKYINIVENICNNNTLDGISITQSRYIKLENNSCDFNNRDGITLFYDSRYIIIKNNSFCNNYRFGMYLVSSYNCSIESNIFLSNHGTGLSVEVSYYNIIKNNLFGLNKQNGMAIIWSEINTITYNTFISNLLKGINITESWNSQSWENIIHHNNFIDNNNGSNQATDSYYFTRWFIYSVGNYWSDYQGVDNGLYGRTAGDGIGDTLLPIYPLDLFPATTPFNCKLPPITPQLLDPGDVDSDGDYSISWSKSFLSMGYILEEDTNKSFSSPTMIFTSPELNLNVTRKENGTYYYRVKAFNEYGESKWSNIEDIIVDWLPEVPENFVAENYPYGNVLNLSWAPNIVDTSGYIIYSNHSGNWTELVVCNGTTNVTFDHTGLTDGESYYYYIRAFDARLQLSAVSDVIVGIPWDSVPPAPPKELQVIGATIDSLYLTWKPNTEEDLEGYNLYRSSLAETDDWGAPIITVEKDNEEFNDTGLDENTTYFYVVTAFDEVPNESGYSNLAFGTTLDDQRKPEIKNSIADFEILEDTIDNTTINLFYWFTDVNNDELTFYYGGAENISVHIYQNNGSVVLIPAQDWNSNEKLTFVVNDGITNVSDEVTVTVTPMNDAPWVPNIIKPQETEIFENGSMVYLSGWAWDPDIPYGDKVTFTWFSNISGKVGVGNSINTNHLPAGEHLISCFATDLAGATSMNSTTITILPYPEISEEPDNNNDRNEEIEIPEENNNNKNSETMVGMVVFLVIILIMIIILITIMVIRNKKSNKVVKPEKVLTPKLQLQKPKPQIPTQRPKPVRPVPIKPQIIKPTITLPNISKPITHAKPIVLNSPIAKPFGTDKKLFSRLGTPPMAKPVN
jgi:parallel beta-helix repeat protein